MNLDTQKILSIDWDNPDGVESQVRREPEVTLRRPDQYGVCLWWSDELPCFVHPDDQGLVDQLVPGNRVFKKQECPNFADRELGYAQLSYGDQVFRALPAIWFPLAFEGYEIGDRVEIKSRLGKHQAMICTIREIQWNQITRRIDYLVESKGAKIRKPFVADDFQPALRLNGHLSERELDLVSKSRFS